MLVTREWHVSNGHEAIPKLGVSLRGGAGVASVPEGGEVAQVRAVVAVYLGDVSSA